MLDCLNIEFSDNTYIILPIAYEVSTYSGFQSKWSCMYYFHQIMGRSVKLRGKIGRTLNVPFGISLIML